MNQQRNYDQESKTFFRSDRMVRENGQWYFTTREGQMQGPFDNKEDAQRELNEYIKIMKAHSAGELSLAPLRPLVFPANSA